MEQEGLALLLIEQNLGVATSVAERQLIMVGGEIAHETTATSCRRTPSYSADILASSLWPTSRARLLESMHIRLLLPLAVGTMLLLSACGGGGDPRPDLLFVSTRDGDYAIYAMNADGARQKRLTRAEVDTSSPAGLFFQIDPAWSPDGATIAFASRRAGTFDIYVMRADGTGTRRLTATRVDDAHPTWAPDGQQIAFKRADDIYVMNADGTSAHRSRTPWDPTAIPHGLRTGSRSRSLDACPAPKNARSG